MLIHNYALGSKCAKRTTICIIVCDDGDIYIGSNDVANPQEICPRADMPTETGYELCKNICGQRHHAEVAAAEQVGPGQTGIAFLIGHNHACQPCQEALIKAGVRHLTIIDVNAR